MTKHAGQLPEPSLDAVLLDLDGVVTDTAGVHAEARKPGVGTRLAALRSRFPMADPCRMRQDETARVADQSLEVGVRSLRLDRTIRPMWGEPDDPLDTEPLRATGNAENRCATRGIDEPRVGVLAETIALIEVVRTASSGPARVAASNQCRADRARTSSLDRFDVRVAWERKTLRATPGTRPLSTFEAT